ncbi:MAG: PTS fructose transporter subunit IIA [Zetaproteobacteria bacterium]|nr:MAG: PTS fructose transporter subunit IIA [Zetaproteobacteria bacterium]
MVGIVIVGHGRLPEALFCAVEHVLGPQSAMEYINVAPDDDPEEVGRALTAAVDRCDGGDGVIVCADMFGGTPCNIALGLLDPGRVEVVSGISLPALIAMASERGGRGGPERVARKGVAGGRRYLCPASTLLSRSGG